MRQQIYTGKDAYKNIEDFLIKTGSKRFLLVCDSAFRFLSLQDYFIFSVLYGKQIRGYLS